MRGGFDANLFEEPTLLDDICDSLLSYTSSFVDVLQGIELFRALMLDDPHLIGWRGSGNLIGGRRREDGPCQKHPSLLLGGGQNGID